MAEIDRDRIGSALRQMAQDLIAARRQIASLKRENAELRAQLERIPTVPEDEERSLTIHQQARSE